MRESQERFAILFRNSPAGVALHRLSDGQCLDVNERFLDMVGFARDEVIGRSTADLGVITAEVREQIGQRLRTQGALHDLEVHIRIKSGHVRMISLSLEVVEVGNEACGLSLIYDITERTQSQAALHASEAKLWALFDVLPVGISILDSERRIVESNPALERILGISQEGLVHGAYEGRTYIHPNGTALHMQEFPSWRAVEEQRAILDVEIGVVVESGQTIWTSVSAAPLSVADLGVVVVTTDITERQRAEAALTQERDLLQALMDNIPDTIYFKDTASRFTRINPAQARVLGVSEASEAIGKTDADFQASHLAAEFHREEQRLLHTGRPLIDRLEFNPTADGQPRWFSATKVPMYDRAGHVIGLIGISRDITERIKAEEALQQANAQLTDRVGQMALLNELAEQLQACVTLQEVYDVTAALASQLFRAEVGVLSVIKSSRNRVEPVAAWGGALSEVQAFGIEDCWALRRGQMHISGGGRATIVCSHLKAHPRSRSASPYWPRGKRSGSCICDLGQPPKFLRSMRFFSSSGLWPMAWRWQWRT